MEWALPVVAAPVAVAVVARRMKVSASRAREAEFGQLTCLTARELRANGEVPVWCQTSASMQEPANNVNGQGKMEQTAPPQSRVADGTIRGIVCDFCEKYPAIQVAPTTYELDQLWDMCCIAPPFEVCAAIREQLSWHTGHADWQPRLRALYVAADFCARESMLGEAVCKAVGDMQENLKYLCKEIPQCKDMALKALAVARDYDLKFRRDSQIYDVDEFEGNEELWDELEIIPRIPRARTGALLHSPVNFGIRCSV